MTEKCPLFLGPEVEPSACTALPFRVTQASLARLAALNAILAHTRCQVVEPLCALPLQVVTHSQRFASASETLLRLDHGQIAYVGPPSNDPFKLWGPEPGADQVQQPFLSFSTWLSLTQAYVLYDQVPLLIVSLRLSLASVPAAGGCERQGQGAGQILEQSRL